jgi:hypothetical protein
MKLTKIVSFVVCLIIALLLTSELRVKYFISEINTNSRSFHLEENTPDNILTVIDELAKKYGVTAYILTEHNNKQGGAEYTFYQTSDFDKNFRYTYNDNLKSIFYGNISINRVPFTSFSGIMESTYFTVKGENNDLNNFFDEMENYAELLNVSGFNTTYGDDMITTYLVIWAIIAVFMFFVSIYQVSVFKREKMIAICNGNSPVSIILNSMLSDLAFVVPTTAILVMVVSKFASLQIDRQLIILLGCIIIVSVLPYIAYARFSIRAISHENKMLSNLVALSRIFKVVITAMLIGIVVTSATSLDALMKSYKSNLDLEEYLDYDIVKISANDISDVPDEYFEIDPLFAQIYADEVILKDVYTRFYEECDITIIDCYTSSDDYGEIKTMYCNSNATEYINSKFPQYTLDSEPAEIYFLIPKNQPNNEKRLDSMKTKLMEHNCRNDLKFEVIYYDENINLNYFDSFEDALIGNVEAPYLIFDTTIPTSESLSSEMVRLSTSDFTMKINDDLTACLDTVNAKSEKFNLRDSIEYQIKKSKSEMLSLIAVMVMLLILEIIMIYNIFSFDYRRNIKEYCIKRSLGCNTLGKYKGQLVYIILIYVISMIAICILFKSVNTALVIVLGSALMMVDLISIILCIVQTENKKVLTVLKGGML